MESRFFDEDIKAVEKAIDLIRHWNLERVIDKHVQLNRAQVWTFSADSSSWAGQKVLQEPFIENWEKFNSNSGWVSESGAHKWADSMQALSHYSYHASSGQFVLCDLQGGIYDTGAVLTDPVILSRRQGAYGVTDLGPRGISSFFGRHRCNQYCRSSWQTPKDTRVYSEATKGTTMDTATGGKYAPTRPSRPMMSAFVEEDDY